MSAYSFLFRLALFNLPSQIVGIINATCCFAFCLFEKQGKLIFKIGQMHIQDLVSVYFISLPVSGKRRLVKEAGLECFYFISNSYLNNHCCK